MSRTTIEVTEDVKESLREERAPHESNYNETIARLLGQSNTAYITESEAKELVSDMVVMEALK